MQRTSDCKTDTRRSSYDHDTLSLQLVGEEISRHAEQLAFHQADSDLYPGRQPCLDIKATRR